MSSFRRILCALGGTPSSEAALAFGVDLASRTGGVVDVVHPLPRERLEPGRPAASANELRAWRDAVRDVERRISQAAAGAAVLVRPHVRSGSLAQVVAFVAESERSELVVVSRHTLHALREEAPVAELLALEGGASPPLLVLPEARARRTSLPRDRRCRVLAPLLSSDAPARPSAQLANELCAALDAELLVTHAGERFSVSALAQVADEARADLVVVETPDESRLSRALHGGGAGERLVERSRRPVLLVSRSRRPDARVDVAPGTHQIPLERVPLEELDTVLVRAQR